MNTKFTYMYRDANNYKVSRTIILEGKISRDQIEPFLLDGENFIASQVGLEDIQVKWREEWECEFPTEDDHVYCELVSVEETNKSPTDKLTAKELLKNFQTVKNEWDEKTAMTKLGIE